MSDRIVNCRSCRAQIIWLTHEVSGKRAPIDATPNPAGPVVRIGTERYRIADKFATPQASELRWTNHFQTCPNAKQHKKTGA